MGDAGAPGAGRTQDAVGRGHAPGHRDGVARLGSVHRRGLELPEDERGALPIRLQAKAGDAAAGINTKAPAFVLVQIRPANTDSCQ